MTDESRRRAIKRHLERHPGDPVALALTAQASVALRSETEWANVRWRDAVDDFILAIRETVHA